eukprot:3514186-Pyramimonas_sp.AAC.1
MPPLLDWEICASFMPCWDIRGPYWDFRASFLPYWDIRASPLPCCETREAARLCMWVGLTSLSLLDRKSSFSFRPPSSPLAAPRWENSRSLSNALIYTKRRSERLDRLHVRARRVDIGIVVKRVRRAGAVEEPPEHSLTATGEDTKGLQESLERSSPRTVVSLRPSGFTHLSLASERWWLRMASIILMCMVTALVAHSGMPAGRSGRTASSAP